MMLLPLPVTCKLPQTASNGQYVATAGDLNRICRIREQAIGADGCYFLASLICILAGDESCAAAGGAGLGSEEAATT